MTPASFVPRLTRADGATRHFAVTLEPRHPFLDHHRPGGAALFGTAMNIEVMAAAARAVRPDLAVLAIAHVEVAAPCVLHADSAAEVFVRARIATDGAAVTCAIVSGSADGEVLHASGTVRLGAAGAWVPPGSPTAAAPAAVVYRLFFHGPAFQVIAGATLHQGTMVCRFAYAPATHDTDALRLHSGPRVIEFCLQTAGLLELATSGRMMIPRRIGTISPLLRDAAAAGDLVATARYRAGAPDIIDIAVTAAGADVLAVTGYETVPLPFAAAAGAQGVLRLVLCRGGCGVAAPAG